MRPALRSDGDGFAMAAAAAIEAEAAVAAAAAAAATTAAATADPMESGLLVLRRLRLRGGLSKAPLRSMGKAQLLVAARARAALLRDAAAELERKVHQFDGRGATIIELRAERLRLIEELKVSQATLTLTLTLTLGGLSPRFEPEP